jgi:DNA-binding transcriptional ArsR family regulator
VQLKKLESYYFQKEQKRLNEEKIVNCLAKEEVRFKDLLGCTGLSRPVLTQHLKRMENARKIKKGENGYVLMVGRLEHGYIRRTVFSVLSTQLFNGLFEATASGKLSDKEFIQKFNEKVGLLESFILYLGLTMRKQDPAEGGKWIEEGFGTLIQKYAWRRCFSRQIMGGEYDLIKPVRLKGSVNLEVKGELITLPGAYVPGVTEEILRNMPEISKDRLECFKRSLEDAYPEEMKKLNELLSLIGLNMEVTK